MPPPAELAPERADTLARLGRESPQRVYDEVLREKATGLRLAFDDGDGAADAAAAAGHDRHGGSRGRHVVMLAHWASTSQ